MRLELRDSDDLGGNEEVGMAAEPIDEGGDVARGRGVRIRQVQGSV